MTPEVPAFHPYGPSHQAALWTTLGLLVVMLLLARTRFKTAAERTLGTLLLALYPGGLLMHSFCGSLTAGTALPLQYCDIAAIAGGVALWTRRQFWCEVVYFFGIAGTLQGLLTPALIYEFPDARFFHFFAMHGGVPVTSLYVVTAMKHRPAPGAVIRIFSFSVAWYAVAAVVNQVSGSNFAFQCIKPHQASLFDQLGPWPWYNFSAMAVGFVVYSILYLPFSFRRVQTAQKA